MKNKILISCIGISVSIFSFNFNQNSFILATNNDQNYNFDQNNNFNSNNSNKNNLLGNKRKNSDKSDSQNLDKANSQNSNKANSQNSNKANSQNSDKSDSQNSNKADSQNSDKSDSQNSDKSDSQNSDKSDSQNSDKSDSQNLDKSDSQNLDKSDFKNLYKADYVESENNSAVSYDIFYYGAFQSFSNKHLRKDENFKKILELENKYKISDLSNMKQEQKSNDEEQSDEDIEEKQNDEEQSDEDIEEKQNDEEQMFTLRECRMKFLEKYFDQKKLNNNNNISLNDIKNVDFKQLFLNSSNQISKYFNDCVDIIVEYAKLRPAILLPQHIIAFIQETIIQTYLDMTYLAPNVLKNKMSMKAVDNNKINVYNDLFKFCKQICNLTDDYLNTIKTNSNLTKKDLDKIKEILHRPEVTYLNSLDGICSDIDRFLINKKFDEYESTNSSHPLLYKLYQLYNLIYYLPSKTPDEFDLNETSDEVVHVLDNIFDNQQQKKKCFRELKKFSEKIYNANFISNWFYFYNNEMSNQYGKKYLEMIFSAINNNIYNCKSDKYSDFIKFANEGLSKLLEKLKPTMKEAYKSFNDILSMLEGSSNDKLTISKKMFLFPNIIRWSINLTKKDFDKLIQYLKILTYKNVDMENIIKTMHHDYKNRNDIEGLDFDHVDHKYIVMKNVSNAVEKLNLSTEEINQILEKKPKISSYIKTNMLKPGFLNNEAFNKKYREIWLSIDPLFKLLFENDNLDEVLEDKFDCVSINVNSPKTINKFMHSLILHILNFNKSYRKYNVFETMYNSTDEGDLPKEESIFNKSLKFLKEQNKY